jgi:RNA polymerase sigma factor (TIGR02999 family)
MIAMADLTPKRQMDELLPLVYDELRELASRSLDRESPEHSFQTTDLLHEAYVRLAKIERFDWQNKDHILRMAVMIMRRVLIDHARAKRASKRSAVVLHSDQVDLSQLANADDFNNMNVIALDEVLKKLAELDERKAAVVELRFFGGQQNEDIARILGVSIGTVKRDWTMARAWLNRELSSDRGERAPIDHVEP